MSTSKDLSELDEELIQIRCNKDIKIIKNILFSYGYFDCEVNYKIISQNIHFLIKKNERYKLSGISIIYKDRKDFSSGLTVKDAFDLIGKKSGDYTDTVEANKSTEVIKRFFKEKGFAFVDVKTPLFRKNDYTKTFEVIYNIKLNGLVTIKDTKIEIKSEKSKTSLDPFVRNRIFWKKGDTYDIKNLEKTKNELLNSGIFSSIEISLRKVPEKQQDVVLCNVIVYAEEEIPRNVSAGIKFGSTEKFGTNFSWTHYNIDEKGSKLFTGLDASKIKKEASIKYNIYDILFSKQKLKNKISYLKEDVNAYNIHKASAQSILWQNISSNVTIGIGGTFERTIDNNQQKKPEKKIFHMISTPIGLIVDTTRDYLNPQHGFRIDSSISPYFGLNVKNFIVVNGKASVYIPLFSDRFRNKMVLACYTRSGSIIFRGDCIPKDKLFFSGGSGSIRGYGHQMLGEINDNKKPLGGESIFEIGVEPRVKISDDIGIVTFIEGGNVFNSKFPQIRKKLMWCYGVGIRYYTSFAPIRVDIAFPFSRRKMKENKTTETTSSHTQTKKNKRIDSIFNIYISFGQSF